MPNCPQCGSPTAATDVFCNNCGQKLTQAPAAGSRNGMTGPISQRACPTCGAPLTPTDRFCIACGTPLGATAATPVPRAEPSPAPTWTPAPTAQAETPPGPPDKNNAPGLGCYLGAAAAAVALIAVIIAVGVGVTVFRRTGGPAAPGPTLTETACTASECGAPTTAVEMSPTETPAPVAIAPTSTEVPEPTATASPQPTAPLTAPSPTATAAPLEPTETPPAEEESDEINTFSDDFSTTDYDWSQRSNENGHREILDEAYVMQDYNGIYVASEIPSGFTPIVVTFDAAAGPVRTNGEYGVICHYQDDDNWDTVAIHSGEGSFHVAQLVGGEYREITSPMWQAIPAFDTTAGAANTVTVVCLPDVIRVSINEVDLGDWVLPVPRESGTVHLFIYGYYAYDTPYTVTFDNVTAWD